MFLGHSRYPHTSATPHNLVCYNVSMSFDENQISNKMMTAPPEKKEFHFSGDGIWRNKAIIAETREEAEKIWHSVKELINPAIPSVEVTTTAAIEQAKDEKTSETPVEQSTPVPQTTPEEGAVQ